MLRKRLFLCLPLAFCFVTNFAAAQSPQDVGPFGTAGGGPFDRLNLATVNVHFDIPIMQKVGRGLPFFYILSFDSNVWTLVTSSGTTSWQPVWNWGWRGQTEIASGYVDYKHTQKNCNIGTKQDPIIVTSDIYNFHNYHDQFGVIHPINTTVAADDPQCVTGYQATATTIFNDGSGFTASLDNGPTATILAKNGETINPPLQQGTGSATATDSNGNQVTTNGSSFTDTLGTTALTVSGGAPNPLNFTYTGPTGASKSVTLNYTTFNVRTNFGCTTASNTAVVEYSASQSLVTSVGMPDGTSYTVTYEATPGTTTGEVTGRIKSIALPSGGTFTYTYSGSNNGINCSDGTAVNLTRATPDGTWTYTHTAPAVGSTSAQSSTTVTDPNNNQTSFNFQQVYETSRTINQGSSTALRTIQTCYNGAAFPCDQTAITLPVSSRTIKTTLNDVAPNLVAQMAATYVADGTGRATEIDDYDWGSGSPGSLIRKTLTSYAFSSGPIGLPSQIKVQDGNSNIIAQTSFNYDETAVTTTSAPQHVAVTGSRGNATTISYRVSSTETRSRTFTYFDTGMIKTANDLAGNSTSFTYDPNCGVGLPTQVSMPLSLSRSMTWNCNGAVMTSSTDENGQITNITYGDVNFWRVTQTSTPDTGQTTTAFNTTSTPWSIDQTIKINSSQNLTTHTVLDGLARTIKRQLTSDPTGTVSTDTTFDSMGRVASVSNPYRSTSDPTYGTTTSGYDALSRLTSVTNPDTTSAGASFSGNCVTFTDESSKKRKNCYDGAGRLTQVFEDPSGANWETDYSYDVLDNLVQAVQKGATGNTARTRTYAYDGISRMAQSVTPEAGTVNLHYTTTAGGLCSGDAASLCSRTDARSITSTYTYDALNRVTQISYSDGTATATFQYDQTSVWGVTLNNPKGRLTHQSAIAGNVEKIFSYDAVGRIQDQWECLPSNCGASAYHTGFLYDVAGNTTQLTYPSGRVISYGYNNASQPTAVTLTSAGGQSFNYAYVSGATYAPTGAPATLTFGNGVQETYTYNSRTLLNTFKISTPATSPEKIFRNLTYGYANNGGITGITESLQGSSGARSLTFGYDAVNRLSLAETGATTGADCWGQTFTYDAFGNATNVGAPTGYTACSAPLGNFSYSAANQITNTGMQYDGGGNMTNDAAHSYQFDAESRIKSIDTTLASYLYDVNSQRVKKALGSDWTEYINLEVESLAEHHGSTDWSDLIYLGGRLIARANSYYYRLLLSGSTTCSNCGEYALAKFPTVSGLQGSYVIQNGDRLYFMQQNGGSTQHGGLQIAFTDGSNTNWTAKDQNNVNLNDFNATSASNRTVDLSSFAGKTVNAIYLVQESTSGQGAYSLYFADIAIVSPDGTVRPIYNGQTSVTFTMTQGGGETGASANANYCSTCANLPDGTTTYLHGDQVGSNQLISAPNPTPSTAAKGFPVWQANYMPFGYEKNAEIGPNNYKFGTYARDAEGSGLDYAHFRYYSSQFMRFMSPDPLSGDAVDPQSLNRYAYALNTPASAFDPSGLDVIPCNSAKAGTYGCGGMPGQNQDVYLDGSLIPGDLVGLLIPDGSAIDCSLNPCGPQPIAGSNGNYIGFVTPTYAMNGDISYQFWINWDATSISPSAYEGLTAAALAEILGLPTQAGLGFDMFQRRPGLKPGRPPKEIGLRDTHPTGAGLITTPEVSRCHGDVQTITAYLNPGSLKLAASSPDLIVDGGVKLIGVPLNVAYTWTQRVSVSGPGSVLWTFSFVSDPTSLVVKTPITCYTPGR